MGKSKNNHWIQSMDSYNFLMSGLEKCDEKLLEPLTAIDWPRDMPVIVGGGLIESATVRTLWLMPGISGPSFIWTVTTCRGAFFGRPGSGPFRNRRNRSCCMSRKDRFGGCGAI